MSLSQGIFLDLEYCYPGMTPEKGRPGEQEKRQIVQISAIRYDMVRGTEVDCFDTLVHPAFEKHLPRFFTQLTGITQRMLKDGAVSFKDALANLVIFCGNTDIWIFNADWNVLRQNCAYFGIPFAFQTRPFTRVKELLPHWGIDPEKYSSGTLHNAVGIEMNGRVHNALHDVRSMAVAVRALESKTLFGYMR